MDRQEQNPESVTFAEEALFGLLIALSGVDRLPVRGWVFADSCAALATRGQCHPSLRAAAESLRRAGGGGVEIRLAALGSNGALRPEGRAIGAVWTVSRPWVNGWAVVADGLPAVERVSWRAAAQRLKRCCSMWEKARAAASSHPEASTSPTP